MSLSHPSFRTATSGGQNTASKPIRSSAGLCVSPRIGIQAKRRRCKVVIHSERSRSIKERLHRTALTTSQYLWLAITLSTFSKYLRGNNGNGNTVFPAVARPPLLLSRRNAATRVACTGSSAGTAARVTADQTRAGCKTRGQARRKRRRASPTASRTSPACAAATTARRSTQPRQQTQSRCATKSGNASDQPA
jgi:hypothetical protein